MTQCILDYWKNWFHTKMHPFLFGGVMAGILSTWWWNKNTIHISSRSLMDIFLGLFLVGFAPVLPVDFAGVFLVGLVTTWIRI